MFLKYELPNPGVDGVNICSSFELINTYITLSNGDLVALNPNLITHDL